MAEVDFDNPEFRRLELCMEALRQEGIDRLRAVSILEIVLNTLGISWPERRLQSWQGYLRKLKENATWPNPAS